jgi:hypothetical protein
MPVATVGIDRAIAISPDVHGTSARLCKPPGLWIYVDGTPVRLLVGAFGGAERKEMTAGNERHLRATAKRDSIGLCCVGWSQLN